MATVEDVAQVRDAMSGKAVHVLSHRQREELAVAAAAAGKDGDAVVVEFEKQLQEDLVRYANSGHVLDQCLEFVQKMFRDAVDDYIPRGGGATAAIGATAQQRKLRFHDNVLQRLANVWRQGCGKYLFPHQSPFSTAGFPAALEAASSGEDRERGPARLYYYK
jgi:hypothetical protein